MICRRPDCDRVLVSHRIPAAQVPPGAWAHKGRGLCSRCYYRAERVGVDGDWIPALRTRDEVMAEWEFLRPTGITRREFAARMGMSWTAFDRMWWRARAAGDPRAVANEETVGTITRASDPRKGWNRLSSLATRSTEW